MDGFTLVLLPLLLDVLALFVLAILLLCVVIGSFPATRQEQSQGRAGVWQFLGPGAIVLLLLWALLVTVHPEAGGQSLVSTPAPAPTHTATPVNHPSPTPTARPKPSPSPSPKPKPSPSPTRRPGH